MCAKNKSKLNVEEQVVLCYNNHTKKQPPHKVVSLGW